MDWNNVMSRKTNHKFNGSVVRRHKAWVRLNHAKNPNCHICNKVTLLTRGIEIQNFPNIRDIAATLDHKLALSKGGWDVSDNWAIACFACNSKKDSLTKENNVVK